MANYSREEMEELGFAGQLLIGLAGIAGAALVGNTVNTVYKTDKRSQISTKIHALDSDINNLSSGFLGALLNSDQIESKK